MDILSNLALGFSVVLSPENLGYCLIGATLGTIVGILPGLGPIPAIALLLPFTFHIPALSALIMLAGIYYGSNHAGSTTAIMLNMPGDHASIVICLDGHPMAREGRAGVALATAAMSSFFAGCISVIIVALFSPILANVALSFASPEYAMTVVLALVMASALAGNSMTMTLGMAVTGLILSTVGTDLKSGEMRFTFGQSQLYEGISIVAIAVGLFAVAETVSEMSRGATTGKISSKIHGLFPRLSDLKMAFPAMVRGTALGSVLGLFPGTGPVLSSFASYAIEKHVADEPSRFGQGAIEGIAGPEAAANAAAITHFIPMLTLGIPAGASMALMLAALQMQGVLPGPEIATKYPELFWGVVASMWIGNIMLLVLNLPMIGIWIRLLMMPYRWIYPGILVFGCIGVYSRALSAFDIMLTAGIGAVGFIFRKLDCSPAPLVLSFVLGPLLEQNFRRAMQISHGDPTIFVTRPISLALLVLAGVMLVLLTRSSLKPKLEEELLEDS